MFNALRLIRIILIFADKKLCNCCSVQFMHERSLFGSEKTYPNMLFHKLQLIRKCKDRLRKVEKQILC